jgi:hypothetical protein
VNPYEWVAGVTGLEPAASCVTGRRSNQLSYTPTKESKKFGNPNKSSDKNLTKDGG